MAQFARHRRRPRIQSMQEYYWTHYQEETEMAIAGSMTSAFRCTVDAYELQVQPMTYPRQE